MVKIPIISISINESLKTFINKLVSKNQYENKSKLIRDALIRLMSTMDASEVSSASSTMAFPITKNVTGSMVVVIPNDTTILKKVNRIENDYVSQIVNKHQYFCKEGNIISFIFEGLLEDFQKIVVEINSIKEVKNFRYLILN
ncbi:MAG: CopG family ribbon-helix-helix protein [Promethearchaeota archaeon]